MIVIDTDVVYELMQTAPSTAVLDRFGRQDAGDLHISSVTEAGIRCGIAILLGGCGLDGVNPWNEAQGG